MYDLVAGDKVPYSRATGKLLFPRDAINQWLHQHSVGVGDYQLPQRPNVFLGSHDPLLEWSIRESRCGIATNLDSSLDGLDRFRNREGVATGLHVLNETTSGWNSELIEAHGDIRDAVLLHWAKRSRGLVLNERLAGRISGIEDIRGMRFAARQPSAGASVLFDSLLARNDLSIAEIQLSPPGRSESDVALQVVEGKADFAFGLASVAAQYRLPFVPLIDEDFDLLVDRRSYFDHGFQGLMAFTRSNAFADRARELQGFDVSECGTVRLNLG